MQKSPSDPVADVRPAAWLAAATELLGMACVLSLAVLLATREPGPTAADGAALAPPELPGCDGVPAAFLSGRLYGDLDLAVDWQGSGLNCGGMLRPEGKGLRLLFEPAGGDGGPLIVVGLAGDLENIADREVSANITIADTAGGRFFNSGEGDRCWARASRIDVQQRDTLREYHISGRFYCAGALAEVNGPGAVTPGEFEFAGRARVVLE